MPSGHAESFGNQRSQVPDKIHKVSNLKRLATPPKDIDKQRLSKKNLDFLTDKKIE